MLQSILLFLLRNLMIIQTGTIFAKTKAVIYLSLVLSPFAFIVEKITDWYITNQVYIYLVCMAILFDWIVGVIKHIGFTKDFSWKDMGSGLFLKLAMAIMGGALFEAFPYFLKENFVGAFLLVVLRLCVFMWPAGSCWVNISVITKGKFPPIGWMKKMQYFNENLDLSHFKNLKNDESTTN